MFNQARRGRSLPKRLSSDHDPLFRFNRWRANLRILDIEESSLFRSCLALIRSSSDSSELRHEYLDQTFFWNGLNLHRKLDRFVGYYNHRRVHAGLGGHTPFEDAAGPCASRRIYMTSLGNPTVQGLFHTPWTGLLPFSGFDNLHLVVQASGETLTIRMPKGIGSE